MASMTGWIVAHLFRWLPHRAPTGLFPLGSPDETSPVLVTANFSLTVERVRRAMAEHDAWLLVVNTDGINVWCAADGGILTDSRVIDAIKVSRLARKVAHRRVILPALAASGVDPRAVRDATGFRGRFGPVHARDIPAYLAAGRRKTDAMRRFDFGRRHRLDMFLSMNFPVYLLGAVVLALFFRPLLAGYTLLFWGAVGFLYLLLDYIPGKTGWGQALVSAALLATVWGALDWTTRGDPLAHWGWLVATFAVFFAAGLDLAGTVSPRRSDAEVMLHRLGLKGLGSLFSEKELGEVRLDRDRCTGCGSCLDICPVGVFGEPDAEHRCNMAHPGACFACGACVKQCQSGALSQAGA